ncbi:MAG: hypothetical protein ACPGUI_00535 [Halarcobacter sp.]
MKTLKIALVALVFTFTFTGCLGKTVRLAGKTVEFAVIAPIALVAYGVKKSKEAAKDESKKVDSDKKND